MDRFYDELTVAREREESAYQRARELVFDRYPPGQVPPADRLSFEERSALDELDRAVQEVKRIRSGRLRAPGGARWS